MIEHEDGAGDEWPQDWMHANTEAMLALSGAKADVVGILVNLLRSPVPLHRLLRDALADAFEDKRPEGCPHFKIGGAGHGPHTAAGIQRFGRDVAIAEFVAARRAEGQKRDVAEREAADRFAKSEAHCHKAVTGYGKMTAWILDNRTGLGSPPENFPEHEWNRLMQHRYLFLVGPLVKAKGFG